MSLPRRLVLAGSAVAFGALLLAGAEWTLRSLRAPPGYFPRNPREDALYVPDEALGYTLRPGVHHQYVTPDLSISIDVSSDGLRDTTIADARRASYRVLAIGDSFTMGLAVDARDTWSEVLERQLGPRTTGAASVVNSGVPGYSAAQIHTRMNRLLEAVQPQVVVYGLTAETYTRMLTPIVLFGGTLVRSDALPGLRSVDDGLLYSPWKNARLRDADYWMNRHFQVGAHLLQWMHRWYVGAFPREAPPPDPRASLDSSRIRRDMQPAIRELLAMRRELDARQVPLVILLVNMQRESGEFRAQDAIYNAILLETCRREGLTCIDLLPTLRDAARGRPIFRTPNDQHWTPAAHALAAEQLLRLPVFRR